MTYPHVRVHDLKNNVCLTTRMSVRYDHLEREGKLELVKRLLLSFQTILATTVERWKFDAAQHKAN